MTSSILPPRRLLAPCSPITHARASTTLDLPAPLGPTMQVMPGSSWSEVADANDLKPRRVRLLRYTCDELLWCGDERPHCTGEERDRRGLPAIGSLLRALPRVPRKSECSDCLLYTSDAADDLLCVDL